MFAVFVLVHKVQLIQLSCLFTTCEQASSLPFAAAVMFGTVGLSAALCAAVDDVS